MIYPDITLDEWKKRFPGLEVQDVTCECGKKGKTTRPFISKDWVGLDMPPCSKCGDECPGMVTKPIDPKIKAQMNAFFGK